MIPWRYLNTQGRLLLCCCVINIIVSVTLARDGSWFCLFTVTWAMFCGLLTYNKKYHIIYHEDIDERR